MLKKSHFIQAIYVLICKQLEHKRRSVCAVGPAFVCAVAVCLVSNHEPEYQQIAVNGNSVSLDGGMVVVESPLHRFVIEEDAVQMEVTEGTFALKPGASFDVAETCYVASDYRVDFCFQRSHVEPRITVTRRPQGAIRFAVDTTGTFESFGRGWQWRNDAGAFRLGPFRARGRDGRAVALDTVVTADSISLELGNATYPVTISAVGNRSARLTASKGLRYVRNRNGILPEAEFLVDGSVVAMHLCGVVPTDMLMDVPESDWWRGCSPTAAGMILGYYDREGYDGSRYDNLIPGGPCELISIGPGDTRIRRAIGSPEHTADFFVLQGHVNNDPLASGRTEADFNCLADFMGTSQDEFNNADGYTKFFFSSSGRPLSHTSLIEYGMTDISGLVGISEYIRYCGYEADELANQYILGYGGNTQGFSLADFQAEIDAGRPVIIHLTGHSMIACGYESGSELISVKNGFGTGPYAMTWGGIYDGRLHFGVSTIRLNIHTQVAPTVSDIAVSIAEGESHEMSLAAFRPGFQDSNGDDITSVWIQSLPTKGVLSVDGVSSSQDDVVTTGTILYTPNDGAYGDDSFVWNAMDHEQYALNSADYAITIVPDNHLPTGADASITIDEDGHHNFTTEDFPFSDADGDTLASLDIVSVPADGSLTSKHETVHAGDVMQRVRFLKFTPDTDENGTAYAAFSFRVGDSRGRFSEAIYTMTINVTPINDPPVAQAAALPEQVDPNETVSLTSSGSFDPDDVPLPLTYSWEQVTLNSPALTIENADQPEAEFTTATPGTYRVRLTIYDGEHCDSDEVDIVVGNVVSLSAPRRTTEGRFELVTIALPQVAESALTVQLIATGDNLIQFPSSVQIPAGQHTAIVEVQVTDDDIFNGNRDLTIGVSGEGVHNGFSDLTIEDDDIPAIGVCGRGKAITNGQQHPSTENHSDFGIVSVNREVVQSFTIQNIGTGTLDISSIRVADDYAEVFSVNVAAHSISRGTSTELQIRMNPGAVGTCTGTVVIESNDPQSPQFTFAIEGTAAEPPVAADSGSSSGCNLAFANGAWTCYLLLLHVLVLLRGLMRRFRIS